MVRIDTITFGIHPDVLPLLGKSVCVIKETFSFCKRHSGVHIIECVRIIKEVCGNPDHLCHDSKLKKDLGCWITITGPGGGNFQLSYKQFEEIYKRFRPTVR